jgi:hypothetical protein
MKNGMYAMKKKLIALTMGMVLISAGAVAQEKDKAAIHQEVLDAIQARDAGDLYGAIQTLENLVPLAANPGRVRLELAVAYYRLQLFERATQEAEAVMADPDTPEEVRVSISLFLADVRAQKQAFDESRKARHQFEGKVSLGVGHDNNVNAGPSASSIVIGDTVLDFTSATLPQDDDFLVANARVDHTYSMGRLLDIGSRPVRGLWQSAAGIYTKRYDSIDDFTLDVVTVGTGPAFLSQEQWRANIFLQFDYIQLGSDKLGLYTSVTPSYTYIHKDTEYTATAQWLNRDFARDEDDGREGNRYALTLDALHKFNNRFSAQAGVLLAQSDYDDDFESADEYGVFANAYYVAWPGGTLYLQGSYTNKDFDAVNPTYAETRDDEFGAITIGAAHSFREGRLTNLTLNAKATFTDNNSNIAAFDYDREEYLVEAIYLF